MSDFVSLLVIGGILGWFASLMTRDIVLQSMLLNIVAGSVGAYLGGVFAGPLFSSEITGRWLAAMASAALLLTVIGVARRNRLF